MRSLLARLAVLGAFALTASACGNGNGTSLPFAGAATGAGGGGGTFQTGGNGTALLRFVQGSPDAGFGPSGRVDVCVDNLPFAGTSFQANYGQSAPALMAVPAGIGHTIAVYKSLASGPGAECGTAPGPYLGSSALAFTTLPASQAAGSRVSVVLGGTVASGTIALYLYTDASFPNAPAGAEVISHNAAPTFSAGKSNGVGFGLCTTTVTPCTVPVNLTGAQGVAAPKKSQPGAAVFNGVVQSGLNAIPAGFYDGIGVPAGTVVPITSVPAPNEIAGTPYVVQLYAIDAPAGGLNLVALVEQTLGFGF